MRFQIDAMSRATSLGARLRGLLGTRALSPGSSLLIAPCAAIHTFGMRFSIDVVFLDRRGRIIRIDTAVAPWRMRWCWRANAVIEMSAGWAGAIGLQPGQILGGLR